MKNVLIVDDHPMVVEIMGAFARTLFPDANVETASALAQAIDCARTAESLDLVLLELRLPDCAGITALTRFRESFPAVPMVVVSATEDRAVPDARWARYRSELGDNFIAVEIDSSAGNPHGIKKSAHSVLTEELVDEPGHPTKDALDRVLAFRSQRPRDDLRL